MFLAKIFLLLVLQSKTRVIGTKYDLTHGDVDEILDEENFIEEAVSTMSDWVFGSFESEESPDSLDRGGRSYVEVLGDQTLSFVDSTMESIEMSLDIVPGGVGEGIQTLSSKVLRKSRFVANTVANMYEAMTSDDENFRFDLILDQITPDVSPLYYICPHECSSCNETATEIVCRVCCPERFTEPISFSSIAMQSGYSAMITNWLLDSIEWTGLKPVFGSWLQDETYDREAHDSASGELKSLIRRFQWLQRGLGEEVAVPPPEDFASDRNDVFSVIPGQICGYYEDLALRRPEGRIMGGMEVDGTRQYPWQLSLATGFMGLFFQHRCGAALISDKWALTAAHCLYTIRSETLYLMGGFLDINNKETAQITKVKANFMHENFVPRLYEQDIALLRLTAPIVYTPSLLPVCLPRPTFSRQQDYQQNLGSMAILTGWGRQWDDGPLSSQLEMVELPIISNSMCMDWYNMSGSKQFIPEHTFLCAGWEEGKMDACSGDSGGPLVVTRADGRAEVMGVVSWGIGCGVKGRPGVYTRVSQFVPWIKKKIRDYEIKNKNAD